MDNKVCYNYLMGVCCDKRCQRVHPDDTYNTICELIKKDTDCVCPDVLEGRCQIGTTGFPGDKHVCIQAARWRRASEPNPAKYSTLSGTRIASRIRGKLRDLEKFLNELVSTRHRRPSDTLARRIKEVEQTKEKCEILLCMMDHEIMVMIEPYGINKSKSSQKKTSWEQPRYNSRDNGTLWN